MNLGIVGSRKFNDEKLLFDTLNKFHDRYPVGKVITGGAKGADKLAEKWADSCNIQCDIYLPEWERYGKSAGIIRNARIVAESDGVIAFWDGESKGTKNSIERAEKDDKLLDIIRF